MSDQQAKPAISVVIPVLNEAPNLLSLIEKIALSLRKFTRTYEIIIVDDHSEDNTEKVVNNLSSKYPLIYMCKVGERGKASSLLQGFSHARYPIIAMIDGDLQYPPDAIAPMAHLVWTNKADVVIADRHYRNIGYIRLLVSHLFRFVFCHVLHNINVDVQSGLKVFRKSIIERLSLNPSPWTFDMEFLLKARHGGYQLASYPVIFEPRLAGKSKVKLVQSILEIGYQALKLKLSDSEIIPLHPVRAKKFGQGFHYHGQEYIHFTSLPTNISAVTRLTKTQILIALAVISAIISGIVIDWYTTILMLVVFITVVYFVDLVFYLYLIYQSLIDDQVINISQSELAQDRSWPKYTILCPLYHEWSVLPQFIQSIQNLDYPKSKLQVLLLLEKDDSKTISQVRQLDLPKYFDLVYVPSTRPKTKPKACNYGLSIANSDYTVIFDAEDIPDKDQLKKAVLAFERSLTSTVCVQAKLNFYNPEQNILTRIFTAEYSLWFDLILSGLQSINAPIPLGGTSNHFRTHELRQLNGWDSFNVTEDCDLGIRLAKQGYNTVLINSTTMEEANSEIRNWLGQRSRWIKGYLQTYLVHMREPGNFIRQSYLPRFLIFQLVVGGKTFLGIINPLMWVITALYFIYRSHVGVYIEAFFPPSILYLGVVSLVIGNFLYFYYFMIGCAKRGQYGLIIYTFLVPFYWLLMSVAAYAAFFQLISAPYYWSKTKHGLHLKATKQNIPDRHLHLPKPAFPEIQLNPAGY